MSGVGQPQQWIEWIEKATVFQGLDQALLSSIAELASLRSHEDGEFFFMQGDPALCSYLLIEGQVRLSQVNMDGQQVMLGYIGPGREFGIIAGLQAANYPVSAQAVERSKALYWDHRVFERLFNEIPKMQRNAMQIMARQIGEFQTRIRELSTQRVERRIALALLRLMRTSSLKTKDGIVIDLPLSRQDLAELAGTTLFTVSRTLKQWENQGLIRSKREQVIICDLDGLMSLGEDFPEGD
jgi:CRP-like cAMP-binding protein